MDRDGESFVPSDAAHGRDARAAGEFAVEAVGGRCLARPTGSHGAEYDIAEVVANCSRWPR